jgi:hypothetical protein
MPNPESHEEKMRRGICCVVALALTFSIGRSAGAQVRSAAKQHSSSVRIMFELLDEIDKAPALSPVKAGEILKIKLEPVPEESNEYLYIFRGHGGLWKQAELRLPRGGDGRRFVLVLEPAVPVPMKDVTVHYGDTFAMESPNPSAGAQATFGYSYDRSLGKLRFAFPSFQEFSATIILFDRM